jgi:hypothetical protein
LLIYQCQTTTPTVTDIEPKNAVISGVIFQPDGTTPAAGARVMIRPIDFLIVPEETVLGKKSSVKDTVQTDDKGVFSFDTSIEAGTYLIEAMSENNIVLIDSIEVNEKIKTITTQPAVLKPAGAIKGSVVLPASGNYQDVFVLAFGIDRFTRVREDGSFCFSNLGEGRYSIRVVSLAEDYGTFDTTGIKVVSEDTTDIGAVVLPFEGIPVPQNVTYTYDTLLLQVTLRWNRCSSPDVKEYAFYRRFADSNMVFEEPIARRPGSDTVFIDSTAMHDFRYEYRLAAVGMNGEEGAKSDGVIVTTASYFTVDTLFNICEGEIWHLSEHLDVAVSANGDLYFTDVSNNCVQVFDKDMNFKRRMLEGVFTYRPRNIKVDKNGLVFILGSNADSIVTYQGTNQVFSTYSIIYILDAAGVILDSITDLKTRPYPEPHLVLDFDVKDSLIYIINNHGATVDIYTYDGVLLRAWPAGGGFLIVKSDNNKIYVAKKSSGDFNVTVFDTLGNFLSMIPVPGCSGEWDQVFDIEYDDSREQLYILSAENITFGDYHFVRTRLLVFDNNNTIAATFYKNELSPSVNFTNFELSENREVVISYSWNQQPVKNINDTSIVHVELIRLNPLNR